MRRQVVMIGPSLASRGGVSTVCNMYRSCGMFERHRVRYLESFREGTRIVKMWVAVRCALALLGLLALREVRLVHVHAASGASIWRKFVYCVMADAFGVPYVVHLHSGKLARYYDHCGELRQRLIDRLLGRSAVVIVITTEQRNWLERRRGSVAHCMVVPNFVPDHQCANRTDDAPTVVFLGRLEEQKGVSTLIDAFALVVATIPDARLRIAGEGDVERYASQADNAGLTGAIDFLGWVDAAERERLLLASSALALPSLFEGLPMAVLEAMSMGVPCVATRVGGLPDIITDGVDGLLFEVGDAAALARGLLTLLEDSYLRRRMGDEAQRTISQRFSASACDSALTIAYGMVDGR